MNIISLGSNCEMSDMVNRYISIIPNSQMYTHLFAWCNITLKGIIHFLKNPEKLNINNFIIVYRLFNANGNNISRKLYYDFDEFIDEIKIIPNISSIHIDIDYRCDDVYIWIHGIQIPFCNFNQTDYDQYVNNVKTKTNHIIYKTVCILNDNNVKLFCIKCLKSEYSLDEIIELNGLLLNLSSNNYISIILEEDNNININNLKLKNSCIISAPKLTGHHEAIYSDRYNTYDYYIQLFKNSKKMLNIL
jgi:hypothetical protein